jgi:2-polyprenyl-3-methyl-5-hydroxy-6-metoxy-1,4-benzoquinol methylase
MFEDVIREYEKLEPAGQDTWRPLGNEKELLGRIRLFKALNAALLKLSVPIAEAKILDVGCGVGHSTRALLEFGARPENILGIDLRSSAIAYAQSLNSSMHFQVVRNLSDWPAEGSFDFCMQCLVFSSIEGLERRRMLATKMEKMVNENGLILWWDLITANSFAGRDALEPSAYFTQSQILENHFWSLFPTFSESMKYRGKGSAFLALWLDKLIGYSPTHCSTLFGKKK